jgi:hypothetical protein
MNCLRLFQRHDWGKWEVTSRYELESSYLIRGQKTEPKWTGQGFYQERECKRCGKRQINKQERGL